MTDARNGRTTQRQLVATLATHGDGQQLLAPAVGHLRGAPGPGSRVVEGDVVGELDVLGVLHLLTAPPGTSGIVGAGGRRTGERAVGYGDVLLQLGPGGLADAAVHRAQGTAAADEGGRLLFRSPLSGRFYARAGPDRPDFVKPGDEITVGQTVALLEVMKTFNRLSYGGPGLPERARVRAVLVQDEADVESGMPILELEPV